MPYEDYDHPSEVTSDYVYSVAEVESGPWGTPCTMVHLVERKFWDEFGHNNDAELAGALWGKLPQGLSEDYEGCFSTEAKAADVCRELESRGITFSKAFHERMVECGAYGASHPSP